ncbi:hypothetical protein [Flavobacterium lacisediminis]|uniref:DUF4468 domain-containing protein n=1 Tax=Flavobacterium lacisediminis TaxID=2989705 RepID=A0ABT3EG94_9FLAO|nr:hypothetical protein [Flavobacterium lacisediminis]MCW1147598.1 hypothetical protein [Flavobacterium lacisediminis]
MKKILLFITFILYGITNAQNLNKGCEFNYQAYSKKIFEDQAKGIFKSVLSWDFSKLENDVEYSIEIVPVRDCINKESAIKFRETVILSSKDENLKKKDSKEISHSDYMTKCFKWRIILVDVKTSCRKVTDWEFISFINN